MLKDTHKGHLAAIANNIIFGLNVNVTKSIYASSWMTPIGFSITRTLFACVAFWVWSLFVPREKVLLKDMPYFAAGGIIGLAVTQLTFALGLNLITPVTSSLIAALCPIVVLLLSAVFLKDSLSIKKIAGVVIGVSGAALVVMRNAGSSSSSNSIFGICLALVSTSFYAANIILIRKISGKYSPVTMMKWMYLFSALILAPFGIPELPSQRIFSPEITIQPVLLLGYSMIFSSVIGLFLMSLAIRHIKASTASMYINLQPLTASVTAIFIGQDILTWDKPLALILVISGVIIVTRSRSREERKLS